MYKAIITYNFSDNNTRDSFTELLVELGLENHPDQSTYVLKEDNTNTVKDLETKIKEWSRFEIYITKNDGVQIYHPYQKLFPGGEKPTIGIIHLRYNKSYKQFIKQITY